MDPSPASGWNARSLIEPDLILPEQHFEARSREKTGEVGLLWAVFIDGIRAFCGAILTNARGDLAYREAERWIFRPDSGAPTSFATLCTLFDIDARELRRRLWSFRERPTPEVARIFESEAAGSPAAAAELRAAGAYSAKTSVAANAVPRVRPRTRTFLTESRSLQLASPLL